MTDIAENTAVKRIARVIAAVPLSPNAEGPQGSERPVADQVYDAWRDDVDRALTVLRMQRDPTRAMAAAGAAVGGDPANLWNVMVRAAIHEHESTIGQAL